jgi:hypothetical protein
MRKIATIGMNRRDALRDGDGKYYGSVCKKYSSHGNVRITNGGGCAECQKVFQKVASDRHYAKNSELYRMRATQWASENPQKRENILAKNRDKFRDERNAASREWFKRNPALRAAYEAERRARRISGTIPGYEAEMQRFYAACPNGFTVDHIVPLKGKRICGLHVPWNLQYLPASENFRKNASFDESQGIAAPPTELAPVCGDLPVIDTNAAALRLWEPTNRH